jgi:hypothetical protein
MDKPLTGFKRGTTLLCVILIMGRENFSFLREQKKIKFMAQLFFFSPSGPVWKFLKNKLKTKI